MARSTRLTVSYVLDWAVVVCFAVAGGVLNYVPGFHRPFSLTNDAIAYPLKDDIVSIAVVVAISLAAPAVILAVINVGHALFPESKNVKDEGPTGFRSRLAVAAWETHAGWLGLCTGLAVTLFVTSGLKDLVGKPRPDMLARCHPDLTNIDKYVVGGFGINLDSEAPPFVTSAICQQPDKRLLDDGFAAFPSGHSSFSSAGLVYLTLWLCARWSIAVPFLDYSIAHRGSRHTILSAQASKAAPPLWQIAMVSTPTFVAIFVCASRYADFHHAGFDIIAGAFIGSVLGWASFRLFHLPVRRSRGLLAWRPRSSQHAFFGSGKQDDNQFDEERARQLVGTELGDLGSKRVGTGLSGRPIMKNSEDEPRYGDTVSHGPQL